MSEQSTDETPDEDVHEFPLDEPEIVSVAYTADIDRDNVGEFIEENHPDADHVRVYDRTTAKDVIWQGERPGMICPECGKEVYGIRSSGGERVYSHGLDDKCVVHDENWEPPRGHPEEDPSLKTRAKRAARHAISIGLPLGIVWLVMSAMPRATMTVDGEVVTIPPTGTSMLGVFALVAAMAAIIYFIQYLPGKVSTRRH